MINNNQKEILDEIYNKTYDTNIGRKSDKKISFNKIFRDKDGEPINPKSPHFAKRNKKDCMDLVTNNYLEIYGTSGLMNYSASIEDVKEFRLTSKGKRCCEERSLREVATDARIGKYTAIGILIIGIRNLFMSHWNVFVKIVEALK